MTGVNASAAIGCSLEAKNSETQAVSVVLQMLPVFAKVALENTMPPTLKALATLQAGAMSFFWIQSEEIGKGCSLIMKVMNIVAPILYAIAAYSLSPSPAGLLLGGINLICIAPHIQALHPLLIN